MGSSHTIKGRAGFQDSRTLSVRSWERQIYDWSLHDFLPQRAGRTSELGGVVNGLDGLIQISSDLRGLGPWGENGPNGWTDLGPFKQRHGVRKKM